MDRGVNLDLSMGGNAHLHMVITELNTLITVLYTWIWVTLNMAMAVIYKFL